MSTVKEVGKAHALSCVVGGELVNKDKGLGFEQNNNCICNVSNIIIVTKDWREREREI